MDDQWMSPTQASEHLGIPLATLTRWRNLRKGPPFIKVGKHLRIRRSALDAWMDDKGTAQDRPASA